MKTTAGGLEGNVQDNVDVKMSETGAKIRDAGLSVWKSMDGPTESWPRRMADMGMGKRKVAIFAFATAARQRTRPNASLWWVVNAR